MREETIKHRELIYDLLKKHKFNYGYGIIAPVDACLGDGDCLFFDFGTIWEKEKGRNLCNKEVQRKLYYILSMLVDEGKVEVCSASFLYGRVNHYSLST